MVELRQTDGYDTVRYPLPGMELMYEDVSLELADVTETEMERIAEVISEELMESWSGALETAVEYIKRERMKQ